MVHRIKKKILSVKLEGLELIDEFIFFNSPLKSNNKYLFQQSFDLDTHWIKIALIMDSKIRKSYELYAKNSIYWFFPPTIPTDIEFLSTSSTIRSGMQKNLLLSTNSDRWFPDKFNHFCSATIRNSLWTRSQLLKLHIQTRTICVSACSIHFPQYPYTLLCSHFEKSSV
jgi:hypothetical protein